MQGVVAAWYSQNLSLLWFTSIGLATAYYLIPKVINKPIYSYNLAAIGFWTFALFGGLSAMVRLSGGPVPAWFVTVGIAANLLMLVPILTVVTNLFFTMRGNLHAVYSSPTIRFTSFGAVAFALVSVVGLLVSLRSIDRVVHFTQFQVAQQHLTLYAFFSMVMFGAIYYITPRLVGCEWLSATFIKIHFLCSAYGGGVIISMLAFSGLAAGIALADPAATFAEVIQMGRFYLAGHTIGFVIVSVAHITFALHFLLMLLRFGQPAGDPTLFVTHGEENH
jgi:cytochrome c oxidase cbb3-type subunit I